MQTVGHLTHSDVSLLADTNAKMGGVRSFDRIDGGANESSRPCTTNECNKYQGIIQDRHHSVHHTVRDGRFAESLSLL